MISDRITALIEHVCAFVLKHRFSEDIVHHWRAIAGKWRAVAHMVANAIAGNWRDIAHMVANMAPVGWLADCARRILFAFAAVGVSPDLRI